MCGIAGVIRFDDERIQQSDLERMTEALVHRGPDGSGHMVLGPVGFGHRRLAIIDPDGSPQPMVSADGRHVITFNGEILNYRQLTAQYKLATRTSGDTEIVLELFAAHGPGIIAEFRGQFAFAILDRRSGNVVIARDRLGILPLYWTAIPGGVAFGSEPKALVPVAGPRVVDPAALRRYLAQRACPAPQTLYSGVSKVLPGTFMRITRVGGITTHRYWAPVPAIDHSLTPAATVERLDILMRDAVEDSLVADVPVGAYLSGGVDSSLVVAIATALGKARGLNTYAAGFDDPRNDERPFAATVSRLLSTTHHEVTVDPSTFLEDLFRLTPFRDAPISETSDIAVAALARAASQDVKVVLSGEGSDELFAGYPKYRYAALSAVAGRVPNGLRASGLRQLRRLRPSDERAASLARAMSWGAESGRFRGWFSPFSEQEVERLVGSPSESTDELPFELSGDAITRMGLVDLASWLPDNLLERGDRMTMASSIELRPPFLDTRLVEFSLTIPSSIKVADRITKWPVKELARRYLPAEITHRPKVGFKVPIGSWFRGQLAGPTADLLFGCDSRLGHHLDVDVVRGIYDRHQRGIESSKELWALLSLEVWLRHAAQLTSPSVEPAP